MYRHMCIVWFGVYIEGSIFWLLRFLDRYIQTIFPLRFWTLYLLSYLYVLFVKYYLNFSLLGLIAFAVGKFLNFYGLWFCKRKVKWLVHIWNKWILWYVLCQHNEYIAFIMPGQLTRLWRNKASVCLQGVQSSEGDIHKT